MDRDTLAAYDARAAAYSCEWTEQPAPDDMYRLLRSHFQAGGRTADIGCGNGRDAGWLAANGYPCVGYDASDAMLAEAGRLHPSVSFARAALPGLEGVADGAFDNVLCETVVMHLSRADVAPAARSLGRIVAPGGMLYLSWRVTAGTDARDAAGRLYTAFPAGVVLAELRAFETVHDEETVSGSSGRVVHRWIGRRR